MGKRVNERTKGERRVTNRPSPIVSSIVPRLSSVRFLFANVLFLTLSLAPCAPHPATASALESAEVKKRAAFQAPLIWRAGEDGNSSLKDLALSKAVIANDGSVVSAGFEGFCELNDPFVTEAPITRLSATWDFTGQVTLEVNATGNSQDYVRVTNGVPLEFKERAQGSRIRWRATLAPQSSLSRVRVVYADRSGVAGSFGNELLSGFKTRKEISIQGSKDGDLFQYPVRIKVGESKKSSDLCDLKLDGGILSDFKDVRFTLADGETVLPHFLDGVSGTKPNREATFWVKIPEIPKEGLLLSMYSGHPAAEDISNGAKVYDFFEDFDGTALSAEAWKLALGDKTGKASVADSTLLLEKAKLTTARDVFGHGVLEYKARVSESGAVAGIIRGTADGTKDLVAYASTLNGSEHAIAQGGSVLANDPKPITPGVFYLYRVHCDPLGNVVFQRFAEDGEGDAQAEVRAVSGVNPAMPLGLASSNQDHAVECDWIRTRQDADSAPKIDREKTAAGVLEPADLPEFENVVIAPDGTLVTKPNASEGAYTSRRIAFGFPARILKATWQTEAPALSAWETPEDVQAVRVSIATKEGGAFAPGWENGVTRYVSKKEFNAGEQSRWRAEIIGQRSADSGQKDPNSERNAERRTLYAGLKKFSLEYYPGTIRVVLPNGSETLAPGGSFLIFWDAPGFGPKYPMEISYATGDGEAAQIIAAKADNTGDFRWTVPNVTTEKASVKVTDSFDKTIFGVSADKFTIRPSSGGPAEVSSTVSASVGPEGTETPVAPAALGNKDYLLSGDGKWSQATAWSGAKVPDLTSDVTLTTQSTVLVDQPISFRRLTIGDGEGKSTTTVVLKAGIDPQSGEIVVRKGGKLVQAMSDAQMIAGDLTIDAGGLLTHEENGAKKECQLNFTARNIILKPGATVSASAKGYSGGDKRQPGQGKSGGKYDKKAAAGGRHNFDTVRMPKELGSGGAGSKSARGGAGGGAIRLIARNGFSISGAIDANGADGVLAGGKNQDGAGGAGGSVYLEAQQFSGQGASISATGGSGQKTGGAGGGGVIHIKAPAGKISGTINANGGSGLDSGAGSVLVE
jgi:hypothetical protein